MVCRAKPSMALSASRLASMICDRRGLLSTLAGALVGVVWASASADAHEIVTASAPELHVEIVLTNLHALEVTDADAFEGAMDEVSIGIVSEAGGRAIIERQPASGDWRLGPAAGSAPEPSGTGPAFGGGVRLWSGTLSDADRDVTVLIALLERDVAPKWPARPALRDIFAACRWKARGETSSPTEIADICGRAEALAGAIPGGEPVQLLGAVAVALRNRDGRLSAHWIAADGAAFGAVGDERTWFAGAGEAGWRRLSSAAPESAVSLSAKAAGGRGRYDFALVARLLREPALGAPAGARPSIVADRSADAQRRAGE